MFWLGFLAGVVTTLLLIVLGVRVFFWLLAG